MISFTPYVKINRMEWPQGFIYQIIQESEENVILRLNLYTPDDVNKWLKEYSILTKTAWIVKDGVYKPQRLVYHRRFSCQHSARNKVKLISNRNTNCRAMLDIKIKLNNYRTQRNDNYLKCEPSLDCVIKAYPVHNHTTSTGDYLGFLKISDDIRKDFYIYFEDGLAPAAACRRHENKLICSELANELSNTMINPKHGTVRYIFQRWRKEHAKRMYDSMERLEERLVFFAEQGAKVYVHKKTLWAILIVTPVMARAQKLQEAGETIYLDSITVGTEGTTMTVMLTASKAGALPICVFIHPGLDDKSYINAFNLLTLHEPTAFGGNKYPKVFMSANIVGQKRALKTIWPLTRILLAHSFVNQSEWKWLLCASNKVAEAHRIQLMRAFQGVLHASNDVAFESALKTLSETFGYDNYKIHIENLLLQAEEWVMLHRYDLQIEANAAYQYSEATIRVWKDLILERAKGFTLVSLIDFCITTWENCLKSILLSVANCKKDYILVKFNTLLQRIERLEKSEITQIESDIFLVPSQPGSKILYKVHSDIGICECINGIQGKFCEHQYIIQMYFDRMFPATPEVNIEDRYKLAQLALGEHCPLENFFLPVEMDDSGVVRNEDSNIIEIWFSNNSSSNTLMETEENLNKDEIKYGTRNKAFASLSTALDNFEDETLRLKEVVLQGESLAVIEHLNKLTNHLKTLESSEALVETLRKINSVLHSSV